MGCLSVSLEKGRAEAVQLLERYSEGIYESRLETLDELLKEEQR
jgi:hypothetical protein